MYMSVKWQLFTAIDRKWLYALNKVMSTESGTIPVVFLGPATIVCKSDAEN